MTSSKPEFKVGDVVKINPAYAVYGLLPTAPSVGDVGTVVLVGSGTGDPQVLFLRTGHKWWMPPGCLDPVDHLTPP